MLREAKYSCTWTHGVMRRFHLDRAIDGVMK
jgi:hypothetical protein